jgi:hypothetical protein
MRIKFSTLVLASAALAAVGLATIPAVAATSTTLNVPFSFIVNGQSLPAGEYSVERDDSGNFLRLQAKKDPSRNFVWVAEAAASRTDRVILKFDPQGPTHVLQSVQYGPVVTIRLDRKTRKTEDITPQTMPGQ